MELEKWSWRVGVTALSLAVAVRLGSTGVFGKAMETLRSPEAVSAMLFLETGRLVRPAVPLAVSLPVKPEAVIKAEVQKEEIALPVFASEDAQLVKIKNVCGLETDVSAMLQTPLTWQLQSKEPTVLIVHSHASESYQNRENYKESDYYRTLDQRYNVVSVGNRLAEILEAGGISVLHDTTLHDYPSYNSSYSNSRTSVKEYLEKYPSSNLLLQSLFQTQHSLSEQLHQNMQTKALHFSLQALLILLHMILQNRHYLLK